MTNGKYDDQQYDAHFVRSSGLTTDCTTATA